ncbi:MAG TPA: Ig-like domain-containing protein, partial [Candidatus Aquicultor sp.]
YYYSVDTAANTEANKNLAIKVDTAAPATFTLSSPADNSWTTNQKPTLGWNASSDVLSGLANYVVRIDGATDQTLTSSTLSATTVATLTEGMHAWQVVAVDNAGNQTAATARTISVDLANPTATITVPTNDATINGTINITGSATDPNFNNYVLDYGSGASPSSWTTIATSNTAVANGTLGTLNTSSIGNGQYTIRLRSYDKASKTATMSILVTVTNDVTPPVTTLSTNPGTADGANGWFKSATAITLTSSEPGSTYYQWDGTGGAWTTYTGPFAVLEGNHALHYYSKDTANNTEVTKNQAIKLDTVAPVAPGLSSPADSAWIINQRPTLGWNSVTDATSGLASYRIKVDASIDQTVGSSVTSTQTAATLTEGTHTWQIIAVDGAGNLGTSASRTINIDIANPTASITAPTDGASVSGTINITGSATDANFKNYALEYGAGATPLSWTPITNPTTPITSGTLGSLNTSTLANGLYTIRLTANDNASKTSTASIQINVTNDVTAPTTTLSTNPSAINGKNGWFNTATTITLSPSEPGTTYYKWDGAPTDTTYTGPFAALEGTHTLSYYSKDTVNNTETVRNQTIKVDTAAPALFNLTSPADASWQSTTSQTLRWGASSDATSNLVSYIVKVDGGINKTVAAGTTQAAVTLTEGSHNWQVIAEDNAGNQTASSTWSVSIDTANPVANIVAPANNATISGTVAINGTASDINIASYKLEYGVGASPSSWTTITSSTASVTSGTLGTLNTTLLADGAYTIRLTVTDKAAKTTVASIAVTANNDTVAPTTTVITSPAAPDGTNGWFKSATTLTLASSEPGSTYYQWDGTGGTWNAYTGPIAAPEGNHTLYYYSKDAINNMEATKNLAVKVDMSAPSTPAMPAEPFNDIWLSTQTPAFKWTPAADSMSGILKYKLMIDGVMNKEVGGAITATTPTALAAGSHTWNIVAVDAAGNEAASSSTWTIKIDLTNPVAVITAPANGALVSNTIAVTGSATDANFEKYVLEYGRGTSPTSWTTINEAINQVNNGTLGSIDTTNWQNGTYTIRLTANDITGRSATTSITVTSGNVDGNPPIWSGSTAVEAVPISYDQIYVRWPEATDTVGVAGYEIHKVYSGTDSIIETGTGTYYIAQGLLPNQEYTFYVKAYDDAGNRSVKTLDAVATTFKKQEYIVTPPSSDKTVEVPLSGIGTKVIFDNVTSGGEVNFVGYSSLPQLKAPLPPLPSDAQPIIGAIFDVALGETFIYEGNVQIIIPYTKLGISQPDKLELWHYNTKRQPAAWETLPKQVRVDQGVVVFTTTSFSPYVLVYSASAPGQVAYGMNTNMLLAMALLMMASGVFFIRGLARHPF